VLAANSMMMGLAHAIIEGRLGDIDDAARPSSRSRSPACSATA